ncbi:MAG: flagellar biosynthesis repressor FlbT [Ignavibacteriales bacterium]|nr:flagellar biosynthesis repressor FlbT [Ignavibacteriales bacterium]
MALKISLKSEERAIIGGAVVRNVSKKTIELLMENEVPLLRERELLSKRIYFVIQLMYVDSQHLVQHQKLYWKLTTEIIEAAPSTVPFFSAMSELIYDGKYYQALKEAKNLITHEHEVMNNARKSGRSI